MTWAAVLAFLASPAGSAILGALGTAIVGLIHAKGFNIPLVSQIINALLAAEGGKTPTPVIPGGNIPAPVVPSTGHPILDALHGVLGGLTPATAQAMLPVIEALLAAYKAQPVPAKN